MKLESVKLSGIENVALLASEVNQSRLVQEHIHLFCPSFNETKFTWTT